MKRAVTAMSERALAYGDEPLKHRILVLYEAEGMSGDTASYLIRSLLSEGCVRYETVEKTPQGLQARLIEREGPTGLIVTTTRDGLHPENETRLISLTLADGQDQTRAILAALADEDRWDEVDRAPWHALQRWIAASGARVVVPFAPALVSLIPPNCRAASARHQATPEPDPHSCPAAPGQSRARPPGPRSGDPSGLHGHSRACGRLYQGPSFVTHGASVLGAELIPWCWEDPRHASSDHGSNGLCS